MGKEWIELKETGQLCLEKILVTFDLPILFVCVDLQNRKYLCLNVDDNNMKYVIAEVESQQLIDMLSNVIPMEAVFRNSVNGKLLIAEYDVEKGVINSKTMAAKEISSDLLPQYGALFELSNKEIDDYIDSLNKQKIKVEVERYFEKKKVRIENCSNALCFVAAEMRVVGCSRLLLTCTKDRCSYDVNTNSRMIA